MKTFLFILLQTTTKQVYPESVYREYEFQQLMNKFRIGLLIFLIVGITIRIIKRSNKK